MAIVLALGCEKPSTPQPAAAPTSAPATQTVTLLAAASTKEAVEEIARSFEAETKIAVRVSPGGSNQLAAQIIAGAPADVFLSASRQWADAVSAKGLAARTRDLLTNDLVLIVPADNPADIHSPADLASPKLKRLALAGENVPAGTYGGQALKKANLYDALVSGNKIARGQDVRATLAYVERGEAEAGVVYATDATASGRVKVVHTFDRSTYDPIVYTLVQVKRDGDATAAGKFFDYFSTPAARASFEKRGFRILPDAGK